MNYKEKLIQFNTTDKYRNELEFLINSMAIQKSDKILDYGCGTGKAVRTIRTKFDASCFGFDVNNYREEDDQFLFRSSFHFPFDKIYFMHSIAHIPDIENVLERLFEWALKPDAKVYVITPNIKWLELQNNLGYMPDPTVNKHYSLWELTSMFKNLGFNIITEGQFGEIKQGINERLFLIAQR